jgi:nuclear inhibitor of protein phosphatase 1
MASQAKNTFEIPKWAGKPVAGLHLDVVKDGKLIQKLMIDEKKCYFFGRNKELCDFTIDHASCSRVHAALLWHKDLNRPFLIDLGSTHGTFIGHIQLENHKPQQVHTDSEIHFGESSRIYIIRERPQVHGNKLHHIFGNNANTINSNVDANGDHNDENKDGNNSFSIPESEIELDNLTEFNTAHNRRIAQIVQITDLPNVPTVKRKRRNVTFNEEDDVINPEDIDPNVGRFRNLVQTTVIVPKKRKLDHPGVSHLGIDTVQKHAQAFHYSQLYDANHPIHSETSIDSANSMQAQHLSVAAKLGISMPNLAPDLRDYDITELTPTFLPMITPNSFQTSTESNSDSLEPKKKKYAKEAWPGKRPSSSMLRVK